MYPTAKSSLVARIYHLWREMCLALPVRSRLLGNLMNTKSIRSTALKLGTSMAIALGSLTGLPVHAAPTTIAIDSYLNGDGTNTNATVATLSLEQAGSNVKFKLQNSVGALGTSEPNLFISKLFISYVGATSLTASSFTSFGGTQAVVAGDFGIDPPGGDSGYNFFIDLDYPSSNNPNAVIDRFVNGEYTTWIIQSVLVSDFLSPVTGSGDDALAMVHIQSFANGGSAKFIGTTADEGGGGPTGVPEPATLGLVGLGLLAAARSRRRVA